MENNKIASELRNIASWLTSYSPTSWIAEYQPLFYELMQHYGKAGMIALGIEPDVDPGRWFWQLDEYMKEQRRD